MTPPLRNCLQDDAPASGSLKSSTFLGLLALSYVLMRLIVYLTGVLAYYFLQGVWKFL